MGKIRNLLNQLPGVGPSKKELQAQVNHAETIFNQLLNNPTAYHGSPGRYHHTGHGGDGSKYHNGLSGSGAAIYNNHYVLRQNARTAELDVPQIKAINDRFADTVVGIGIKPQSTPRFERLGISREQAEKWGSEVDERFDDWAISKKSDLAETNNFYQNQRMYQRWQHRDNDIFTRLHYSSRRDLLNPLQIQFIDPDQIRGDAFTSTHGPQFKRDDGIIRDKSGRETGYKILIQKENGLIDNVEIPAMGRSGRRFMLHGFNPEYAGQGRGYTRYAHALQEYQKLTDFSLAHIQKAIAQASMVGFVKPSKDAPASNPFTRMTNQGVGPNRAEHGEKPKEDPGHDGLDFCEYPEVTNRASGSMLITDLQGGEEMQMFQNTAPVTTYPEFVEAFNSYLTSSFSMPESVQRMKFQESFSAMHGELILFWRVGQIWIHEMVADFNAPIREAWLSEEIAAGRVSAPGWSDPRLRAAWLCSIWKGEPMPNIDPLKTANAATKNFILGAQTADDSARNNNNSSGQANRVKIRREIEEMSEEQKRTLFKPAGGSVGGR